MGNENYTPREIATFMKNVNDRLDKFEDKFDKFCNKIENEYVLTRVFNEYAKANDERVKNNADNIKWTLRTTILTLLGVVGNFILIFMRLK